MTTPYSEEAPTRRLTTPAAEALIGNKFKCLDHGFIYLVDYMGGDASIVQAARVSYGIGTKTVNEDRGLIRYLLRHQHTTPFEMVELKFHVKIPIFVARQWIRHRTANVNELSGRYSVLPDEFYVPDLEHVTKQSAANKQGGGDPLTPEQQEAVRQSILEEQRAVREGYERLLELDVRRELARVNLGVAQYTEWYWKCDLHNIFHFIKLRMDPHAQYEIRVYAEAMAEIVKAVAPMAWEAFQDYALDATRFSRLEVEALGKLLAEHIDATSEVDVLSALPEAWTARNDAGALKRDRERDEFLAKLRALLSETNKQDD